MKPAYCNVGFVVAVLSLHVALLAWSAHVHSPVLSELGHLPAGLSHLHLGSFDAYRVNPPLIRVVGALAATIAGADVDWKSYSSDPLTRCEGAMAIDFMRLNGVRAFWLYTVARWACIPFTVLGGVVCYRWALEIYGMASARVALLLWCTSPSVIGNGALLMPDIPSASLCGASTYCFYKWLQSSTPARAAATGILLGLAQLSKSTLIILLPIWILLWACSRPPAFGMAWRSALREGTLLLGMGVLALYTLNVGYGFEGTGTPLQNYRFQSIRLGGNDVADSPGHWGNRFLGSWMGALPVPLPRNYLQGIDTQMLDFERGLPSFINGKWSSRGGWYFYVYAAAIKMPLGTLVLFAMSVLLMVSPVSRIAFRRADLGVVLPLAMMLLFVSAQTGIGCHFRYIFPALPFFFLLCSRPLAEIDRVPPSRAIAASSLRSHFAPALAGRSIARIIATAATTWAVMSSALCFPHSLSYFNEFAGGPSGGHEHLLGSAVSWGQDLLMVKHWHDCHPDARPFYYWPDGAINPRTVGLEVGTVMYGIPRTSTSRAPVPLEAGWHAVDVHYLHPRSNDVAQRSESTTTGRRPDSDALFGLKPLYRIGYSTLVYYVPFNPTADAVDPR